MASGGDKSEMKRLKRDIRAYEASIGRKATADDIRSADPAILATYKAYARLKKRARTAAAQTAATAEGEPTAATAWPTRRGALRTAADSTGAAGKAKKKRKRAALAVAGGANRAISKRAAMAPKTSNATSVPESPKRAPARVCGRIAGRRAARAGARRRIAGRRATAPRRRGARRRGAARGGAGA